MNQTTLALTNRTCILLITLLLKFSFFILILKQYAKYQDIKVLYVNLPMKSAKLIKKNSPSKKSRGKTEWRVIN